MQASDLYQHFYTSFDTSRLMQILITYNSLKAEQHRDFLGSGQHFYSLKINQQGLSLPLVISIARESFVLNKDQDVERWIKAIKRLKPLRHPLIPPIEILQQNTALAYITPFASPLLSLKEQKQGPLKGQIEDLNLLLAHQNLFIDDVWQIGLVDTLPIAIDWSDLKFKL
jgi:hypothetical protein